MGLGLGMGLGLANPNPNPGLALQLAAQLPPRLAPWQVLPRLLWLAARLHVPGATARGRASDGRPLVQWPVAEPASSRGGRR